MSTSFSLSMLDAHAAEALSTIRFPEVPADACSASTADSMAGTASYETGWIALEQPGSWGKDIYDGSAFSEEISSALKKKLSREGGYRLVLIRKPGRAGQIQDDAARHVFISHRVDGVDSLYGFTVKGVEDLLDLPLGNPEQITSASRIENQVITLVCAHAKRDQCCALRGRPIARFLAEVRPQNTVWECSHLSGHRFAPTAMLLPSGYTYGRVSPENLLVATCCLEETGVPLVHDLRGRSCLTPAEQVAEIGVREKLLKVGEELRENELSIETLSPEYPEPGIYLVHVRDEAGRGWNVRCSAEKTEEILASCGKPPKPAKSYKILEITSLKTG